MQDSSLTFLRMKFHQAWVQVRPHPGPSLHPIWRKSYLWLISLASAGAFIALLAAALAPSPGNHVQPIGGILGTAGLLFSIWIGWYAHCVPMRHATIEDAESPIVGNVSQGEGRWQGSDGKWYAPDYTSVMHDFEDGNGPVLAHRHSNGGGWVADTSTAATTAFVGPDASVFVFAKVLDHATVTDSAWVHGSAVVSENARICGDAEVNGNAHVGESAEVGGNAFITDSAVLEGQAVVGGGARILQGATVNGNGRVIGNAEISGNAVVSDDLRLSDYAPEKVVDDPRIQPLAAPHTNGLAVASLVLGILWVGGVGAILAVIFGHVAKRQIAASEGTQSGRGIAIAGLVLGWIGIAGFVIVSVLIAVAVYNHDALPGTKSPSAANRHPASTSQPPTSLSAPAIAVPTTITPLTSYDVGNYVGMTGANAIPAVYNAGFLVNSNNVTDCADSQDDIVLNQSPAAGVIESASLPTITLTVCLPRLS